jgi:DNA-binding MurR/RpiR family transcriptional regulator
MPKPANATQSKSTPSASPSGASPELIFARSPLGQRLLQLQREASASNRAIADYLLRNPLRIPALGIEELAARASVSTATLSRFARMLGFANYASLRHSVAETLQRMLQPVEKLRQTIEGRPTRERSPLVEGLETTLANARVAAEGLSAENLKPVIECIARASHVYTLGFGLSAHVAAILALDLQPFCNQLTNVVEFGGTEVAAGRLMNISAQDALIVISVPRYANDAINLTQYARRRGAAVIALTDSPASPLMSLADHVLLAPAAHPVMSSSLSAALVVVEALVTTFMVSSRRNVEQAAKLTDAISAYLYGGETGRKSPPRAVKRARRKTS